MKNLCTKRLVNLGLSKRQLSFFVINCCNEMLGSQIPKHFVTSFNNMESYMDGDIKVKESIFLLRENILSDIITKDLKLDALLFGIDIVSSDRMFDFSRDIDSFLFYLMFDNPDRKNHDFRQHEILNDIIVPRKVRSHLVSVDICGLAKEIYERKDWELIPILKDALVDANFPVEYIDHLKQPYHRRGCWVLERLKNESTSHFS